MSNREKGNFSADIGEAIIQEALRAVSKPKPEEVEVDPSAEAVESVRTAESAPEQPGPGASEAAELRTELEASQALGRELMAKLKEEHDRALRAVAQLENYKKRAARELEETAKFGKESLLKDFLPVIDNLDRALEAAKKSADFGSLHQGLVMVHRLFEDVLQKHGVKGFSALGQPFDPKLHEAMQLLETDEAPPNQVVLEVVRGYMLNDRLVRPALVGVAKAKSKVEEEAKAGGEVKDGEHG